MWMRVEVYIIIQKMCTIFYLFFGGWYLKWRGLFDNLVCSYEILAYFDESNPPSSVVRCNYESFCRLLVYAYNTIILFAKKSVELIYEH